MVKFGPADFGLKSTLFVSLYMGVLSAAVVLLVGCSPKDEKVSNRFSGSAGSGTTDARFTDHVTEYSRSMLIELADVARQAESVLQAVANRDVTAVEVSGVSQPAALRTSACKAITELPSPDGSLKFQTEIQACKEKGISFSGTQSGRELSFATFTKAAGAQSVATLIKVEGKGLRTLLLPNANPKDSLRVSSSRFFEAQFVSEENGMRLYRFTFENYSTYDLDLKALTDLGAITSTVAGILVYDVAQNRVSAFRSLNESDRMNLRVESAREGRGGGKIVRQEFYGSGIATELAIDLTNCVLPVGTLKSRFTVRPLVGDKTYTIDSSTVVESVKDFVVNTEKPVTGKARANLCSTDEQITMTEFYAGLLY